MRITRTIPEKYDLIEVITVLNNNAQEYKIEGRTLTIETDTQTLATIKTQIMQLNTLKTIEE